MTITADLTAKSVSLTVPVTGDPGNPRDFVGLYRPGAANNKFLDWNYVATNSKTRPLVGKSANNVSFSILNPTEVYELRHMSLSSDGVTFTVLDRSLPFSFRIPWIATGVTDEDKLFTVWDNAADTAQPLFDEVNAAALASGGKSLTMQVIVAEA